jgi:molecular chaperone GrpE
MDKSGSAKTRTKRKKGKEKKTEGKTAQQQLDVLEEKNKELQDRLLRLAAEFDNYKKRTAREFSQMIKTANQEIILQLVDVLDNFERALESAKSAKDFDSFHQGVELIHDHLREILTREGLQPIEAVGQPFDPHQHEAMMQVEESDHPPDTVVSQMQPGYMLGDKLLRAAKVVVSKRPEKASAGAPDKAPDKALEEAEAVSEEQPEKGSDNE